MDHQVTIRVVMYLVTSMMLFAIALKMFISIKGMQRCEFKTALMLLGASMAFFGLQLLGWGIGDTLKEITVVNPLPVDITTSISAIFVVVAMLLAMFKIQRYLGDGD